MCLPCIDSTRQSLWHAMASRKIKLHSGQRADAQKGAHEKRITKRRAENRVVCPLHRRVYVERVMLDDVVPWEIMIEKRFSV